MAAILLVQRFSRALCLGIALLVSSMWLAGCTSLFFFPQRDLISSPRDIGLNFEDVYLSTPDGESVHGWLLKAKTPRATIVHLHGNAENISTHIGSVYWLPSRGFDVLTIDYEGFGLSTGSPSVNAAREDISKAIEFAAGHNDLPIVILGQSIGGSLAVPVVASSPYRNRIKAVVLDSSFSSFRAIVREKLSDAWLTFPFAYPISWCFSDEGSPDRTIARIAPIPVLIVHAESDPIVGSHHAQRLFDAALSPKSQIVSHHDGHITTLSDEVYRTELVDYLRSVL